jgi:phage N-6-adenine-methyltransferase
MNTYRERVAQAARRKAELEVTESHRVNTGEYEWYTPEQYIEAARSVMGGIDLDPASHIAAQRTVQADHYFTAADDGLKLDWYGRVWLNPPYAQPLMQNFVRKLVAEHANGNVGQAIMLTHNYTDTAWFHEAQAGALLCFTRGRISFVGASGPPTQGQCFFYFGDRRDEFHAVFRPFGFIR